jgi:hypothetical protein
METLRINGYEIEARELRECNLDRDDLLKAVNKIIKEMPLCKQRLKTVARVG